MRKLILLLATALVLLSSASAQSITVDGLEFESVQPNFTENSIEFSNSYMNQTLTPTELFVPDQLHPRVGQEQYSLVTWDGYNSQGEIVSEEAVLNVGFQFENPSWSDSYTWEDSVYPTEDVAALLGNCGGTYYGGCNTTEYPQTYFDSYKKSTATINTADQARIFDFRFNDTANNSNGTEYAVEWDITVKSDYEDLVIEYDLVYNETGKPAEIVWETKDRYQGEDPELLPVEGQINRFDGLNTPEDDYVDRFLMNLDRTGEQSPHNVTVVIAYPEEKELLSHEFGENTVNVSKDYYPKVVETANQIGKNSTLLKNTEGYRFQSFNTTAPANQTTTLQYKIDSELNESNNLRMWILGSFAGGSGTSNDPYQIETCQQLQDIDSDVTASYELISDVDCSSYGSFTPIAGDSSSDPRFTGTLDGNGYTVRGLDFPTKSLSSGSYSGLISVTGSGGSVQDVFLQNVEFVGADGNTVNVGAVVAFNRYGTISDVGANGSLHAGSDQTVGGLVGKNSGTIRRSFSDVSVSSSSTEYAYGVGGIAGYSEGTIDQSYASGSVSAPTSGGLLASSDYSPSNSYWDTEATGQSTSAGGGTGLTTSEMTYPNAESNLANFDFNNSWTTCDGVNNGYPIPLSLKGNTFNCNSKPLLKNFSLNTSNPVYGDWVRWEANVSDPDSGDYVTEVQLEVVKNGSTVFSGNGSREDGLWVSEPVKVNQSKVWYNGTVVSATDSNGATSSFSTGNTASFYIDNAPPVLSPGIEVNESEPDSFLNISIEDNGEEDIAGFSGISNPELFTNSSLAKRVSLPFAASISVTDVPGATGSTEVDVSKSISDLSSDTGFTHTEDVQRVQKTGSLVNDAADALAYDLVLSGPGTAVTDSWSGEISPGSSVEKTGVWEIDDVDSSSSGVAQDESKTSTTQEQFLYRVKEVTNTGRFNFSSVAVSPLTLDGTCSNCNERQVGLVAEEMRSLYYNASGDWITNVENSSTVYGSGEVVFGSGVNKEYTAVQNVSAENTYNETGFKIDFSRELESVEQCSLENDTVQTVAAGSTADLRFEKSCIPGEETGYTPVQTTETADYFEYNYTAGFEVYTNLTEEQPLKYAVPVSRLESWNDKSEVSASVNNQSGNVSVETVSIGGIDYAAITIGDDYGNSSLHTGSHEAELVYRVDKEPVGGGGGGFGGSTGDGIGYEDKVEGEYNWTLSLDREESDQGIRFYKSPGEQFTSTVYLENTGNRSVALDLQCVSEYSERNVCSWVSFSINSVELGTGDFTETSVDVAVDLPENASRGEEYTFQVQARDPSYSPVSLEQGGIASASYVVSTDPFFGALAKVFEVREIAPPLDRGRPIPVPIGAVPVVVWIISFAGLSFVESRYASESRNWVKVVLSLVLALLVFLVI